MIAHVVALQTKCAKQLIVTRKLSWLGLKTEYLCPVDKGEDQNLASEVDLI